MKREIKIGIVVIAVLGMLYWGINFLKGKDVFNKTQTYYVVYPDVKGLQNSDKVRINGSNVGIVDEVIFLPNDSLHRLLVSFYVDSDIAIPKNSIAAIISDILGSTSIDIRLGNCVDCISRGDTLTGYVSTTLEEEFSNQVTPLKSKAEKLFTSIDSVMYLVESLMTPSTRDNIAKSIENIATVSKDLSKISEQLASVSSAKGSASLISVVRNVNSITQNLKNNSEEITSIISNINDISDSVKINFAVTILKANVALDEFNTMMEQVNQGEGSLGKLVYNDSLYDNLSAASKELNQLIEDIKLNPNRYVKVSVFGKKTSEYNEPKK